MFVVLSNSCLKKQAILSFSVYMLPVCLYIVCFVIFFLFTYNDELAYKLAFLRAFMTWSVSLECFLGEQ